MLAKNMHLHLRLEAANEGDAGLCVGQVGDAGVEVEEALARLDFDIPSLFGIRTIRSSFAIRYSVTVRFLGDAKNETNNQVKCKTFIRR